MVPIDNLLAFAAVAFVLIAIPGPSVLFIIGRALALGKKAAIASVFGNAFGVYIQVLAVSVGVGALVERSVLIFNMMKFAGAAYLIYLGVRAYRDHSKTGAFAAQDTTALRSHVFRDAVLVGITNPKAVVFFAAVLPQFVDASHGHLSLQLLTLGSVFIAIALVSDSAWALMAGAARDWFGRSPQRLTKLKRASGVVMIGLGVRLALVQKN